MANLKAEFHEHLTRPRGVKYDEEMNICLLESRLEMTKSHASVVSFDEKVSYLLTCTTTKNQRNMKMRTITCFGDQKSGTFLIIPSISLAKITRSHGLITL